MNLNLGLESLNDTPMLMYRNSENNSNLFNACDSVLGQLTVSIENIFDAAKNVVAVRKAIRQFGKTQSIVALVGQEGLAAAQTFSLEGFWSKAKEIIIKIWEKICEWWNRFWSIFFSNEKKMQELASATGTLDHDVEYEGMDISAVGNIKQEVNTALTEIMNLAVTRTETAEGTSADAHGRLQNWKMETKITTGYDRNANGATRGGQIEIRYVLVKLKTLQEVKTRARTLAKALKDCKDAQKKIDDVSKKALEKAKKMKNQADSEQGTEQSKKGAAMMRNIVQQAYKALNVEAAKLSAHTSIKH